MLPLLSPVQSIPLSTQSEAFRFWRKLFQKKNFSRKKTISNFQVLFPLFSQLDYPVTGDPEPPKTSNVTAVVPKPTNVVASGAAGNMKKDPILCSALMQFICELVEGSTSIQQQVFIALIIILNFCLLQPDSLCSAGDSWSRVPCDLPPSLQEQPRSPHCRPPQHLPQAHQVPRHLSH